MTHPALTPGSVAVITGGAAGIGLAAAKRLAGQGLRVAIADLGADRLGRAAEAIAASSQAASNDVLTLETDVSQMDDLLRLEAAVRERFGGTDVLMNNAGIQPGSEMFGPAENWQRVLAVNLWGVIHGTQVFVPGMLERGRPGLIINTGSKQGITTPPGDPAYNVAKAGVKAFTEALQHELRNRPGLPDQRPSPDPRLRLHRAHRQGPDREAGRPPGRPSRPSTSCSSGSRPATSTSSARTTTCRARLDERRILWAAGDIVENRPPLSRWHPDYAAGVRSVLPAPGLRTDAGCCPASPFNRSFSASGARYAAQPGFRSSRRAPNTGRCTESVGRRVRACLAHGRGDRGEADERGCRPISGSPRRRWRPLQGRRGR